MENNILISIGCNRDYAIQMDSAKECLTKAFPGISFTNYIITPAYGMEGIAPDYANMLARTATDLALDKLKRKLKTIEEELGDTIELRKQGIVMMDIDLLEYKADRYHKEDWERSYIKKLLTMLKCFLIILFTVSTDVAYADKKEDSNLLGMAVEYYQGGKYHECILAFEKLQKTYKLNARFKAYLGMSYFKDLQYEKAAENLKAALPDLKAYSPREQAVYNYSCAESLFQLERYKEAIGYYDKALPLTEVPDTNYVNYDKSDVIYHTAFSYYMLGKQKNQVSRKILDPDDLDSPLNDSEAVSELKQYYRKAYDLFCEALKIYNARPANPDDELHTARIAQVTKMVRWLKEKVEEKKK